MVITPSGRDSLQANSLGRTEILALPLHPEGIRMILALSSPNDAGDLSPAAFTRRDADVLTLPLSSRKGRASTLPLHPERNDTLTLPLHPKGMPMTIAQRFSVGCRRSEPTKSRRDD